MLRQNASSRLPRVAATRVIEIRTEIPGPRSREILAREGVVLSEEDYHERYLGYDDRGCLEAALGDAGHETSRSRVDDLIARKAERYIEVAETGLRCFPGAAECLGALSIRWPLAICSGAMVIGVAIRALAASVRIRKPPWKA